jgi:hypothetical protein
MNRRFVVLFLAASWLMVAANHPKGPLNPDLQTVKTIYLLPMSGSLDQYLVNWLTRDGRFQVVTDPADADAIMTDRVGEAFEARMAALYPVEKEEPKPAAAAKDGKDVKSREDAERDAAAAQLAKDQETIRASQQADVRVSSFSAKGNVFLVHATSRKVIWSYYKRPKSRASDDMNRIAADLAKQLLNDSSTAGGTKP